MMGDQIQKLGVLLVAILISMIALTVFSDTLLTNVTNPVSQTFTSQETQNGAGSPDLTLNLTGGKHWFTDTTEMTVTGSTSGVFTTGITVSDTRESITFDVPVGATVTEDVTVSYVTEDVEGEGTVGWKLVPLFLILLALGAVGGAIFTGFVHGRQANMSALLVAIGILFVGVIIGEVVKTFTDDAVDTYALQPDYTGVGTLLPIVDLGYVFALFGIAAGGMAGFGTKVFRG